MLNKTTLYHFITFLLLFTMFFSNNCIEIFAETESGVSSNV